MHLKFALVPGWMSLLTCDRCWFVRCSPFLANDGAQDVVDLYLSLELPSQFYCFLIMNSLFLNLVVLKTSSIQFVEKAKTFWRLEGRRCLRKSLINTNELNTMRIIFCSQCRKKSFIVSADIFYRYTLLQKHERINFWIINRNQPGNSQAAHLCILCKVWQCIFEPG